MASDDSVSFYLVRLSYTAAARKEITERGESFDKRMAPVRSLAARLGGAFASSAFKLPDRKEPIVLQEKGIMIDSGEGDIVALMAFPDAKSARSFSWIVSSEPGVQSMRMTPILALADFLPALGRHAKSIRSYAAPGRPGRAR